MKVGKMAAIAVGGGIILLQIANQQGYIQIDWNKINKKVDKVTDKVEEAVTGQGPSWADKVSKPVTSFPLFLKSNDSPVTNVAYLCDSRVPFTQNSSKKMFKRIKPSSSYFQVLKVAKENSYLATGFVGGFLIGMASS